MAKITQKMIMDKLSEVMDPELGISIVDMGLIYKTELKPGHKLHILMTLTTIGCPLFEVIEGDMRNKIRDLGFENEDIGIELTFDPPWSMDRMSDSGKARIGI